MPTIKKFIDISSQEIINIKFDPLLQTRNKKGVPSKRGTSGKYYCGNGDLVVKCDCDGKCGPNNGCNCVDCMRL